MRSAGDLVPYASNSRTHSEEQVAQIMGSIREFGFTNPVLIDSDNGVIAGHGRLQAAKRLNIEKIPCIVLGHLSDAQKKAYIIADNKLALNAGWDDEMLRLAFEELSDLDFDLSLTGFSEEELSKLLAMSDEDVNGLGDPQIDGEEYLVIIECMHEDEQEKLYGEMKERGFNVRVLD